jgi:hypothetical protein
MAKNDKLTVKIQIKITEENKANLDRDIPILAKQVRKQIGTEITRSDFLRLVLEELHKKIAAGKLIIWPPRLKILRKKPPKRRTKPPQKK